MKKKLAHAMGAASGLALAAALTLIAPATQAQSPTSTLVRVSSFDYDANGLLIQEVVEPERPNDCLRTSYQHDSFGNRVSASTAACIGASGHTLSSAGAARASTTEYAAHSITIDGTTHSSPAGAFPTRSTNALGQSEHKQYDPRHGGITRLSGPNGLVTTWAYDSFGRKTRETRADGTYTTWTYQLCQVPGQPRDALCPSSVGPHSVAWYASEASFDATNALLGPAKHQFHDPLDRVVRVQTLDFAGQVIVQDTHYNALGQVSQKSILYRPADNTPHWTTYTYDRLGRVITESGPDGNGGQAITQMAYSGLATTITNAQGQSQTTHKNASGQTARVVDHLGSEITYTHDALGQLTQTNAAGTVTRISYTQRGHKASMQDPAMGAWDYAYNAFGELVWQQDSLSQTSTMAYDALGRMTQRTEPDLVSRWYFDKKADNTACGAGIGKLCEASANNGYRRLHTYDTLGRPTSTATALDSATNLATVSLTYHLSTGRPASQTWPSGYRATYTYTAQGFLSKVTGGGITGHTQIASLEVLAMDPQGRITQYRQGNNVITVKTHDQPTGKLHRVQATLQGQATGNVLDHRYTYDKLGNLLTRSDAHTGVAESFQYDALNRLGLYTVLGGGLAGAQTIQTLYDASGNLKYKSDVGYYHHDAQRPSRLNHITLAPEANWSAIGSITQANTGTVSPDDEVAIKLGLEVSALAGEVRTAGGSVAYQIGTRNANTTLRLRDGETQVLGGLISNEDRATANRVPGLGDLPLAGRLFSSQKDDSRRTELVLAITPRILRGAPRPDADQAVMWVGTENFTRPRAAPSHGVVNASASTPVVAASMAQAAAPKAANLPQATHLSLKGPGQVEVGDVFTVALHAASGLPLKGMPMDLRYSSKTLQVESISEGSYFRQSEATSSFTHAVNAGEGRISVGLLSNAEGGVSGEGDVILLRFKALAAGKAELNIQKLEPLGVNAVVPSTSPAAWSAQIP